MKNWKLFFSITLSTLVLFNTLRASFTYAYYNIDPIGFIEALCENKDKPELECNGKCQLKKVTNSTNDEKNQPIQLIDFKDILLYNQKISAHQINNNSFINKSSYYYLNLYNFKLLETCFHPPNA